VTTSADVNSRRRVGAEPGADQAIWLYAIVQSLGNADVTGLRGVGGGHVRLLGSGPLTAVVESVDADAYSTENLQARLSEAADLEVVARLHHEVVVEIAALRPALPFRLATVYLSDDRVRRLLSDRADEFCRTLGWLADRTECGIKAWADPDLLRRSHGMPGESVAGADGTPTGTAPPDVVAQSGAAYLSRRRCELAARAEGQNLAARCGQEMHAALVPLAVSSHLHPLHDQGATGDGGLQVLNAAYLVESASVPEFAEAAQAIAAEAGALRVAVTGPWPAYSFADGPGALLCRRSLPESWPLMLRIRT
jgi:Gas vesicle synthesis protein GvpL/GvpF